MPFTDDGNWWCIRSEPSAVETDRRRPALFLDRDGTLIEDPGYLGDPHGVRPIPGAAALAGRFLSAGYAVVIVTNQSGIGRGFYDWDAFNAVQERLADIWRADGAFWHMELACPFHPEAGQGRYARDDEWRKPRPGMILFAADRLALDLDRSILIGDGARDIEAGRGAGVGRSYLFRSAATGRIPDDAALVLDSFDALAPQQMPQSDSSARSAS